MDERRQQAKRSLNSTLKFAAEPDFDVEFSEAGELILASQHMTYSLRTMAATSDGTAQQYREFSDWYARFNTIANPGSLPQFPRLVVNKELADRSLVPTEVILNTRTDTARSEHNVSWLLLEMDQQRIAQTAEQLASFNEVDFQELLAAPAGNLGRK
jgi:hypothetical protein